MAPMNSSYLLPVLLAASQLTATPPQAPADVVTVGTDDVVIDHSCTVRIAAEAIPDADGNGVIQIHGNDLVVDFAGARLHGSAEGVDPDGFTGVGVHVAGNNIKITGLHVSGFKVGILAEGVDGLVIEGCDVSDNYAQRLLSTPTAENAKDWLYPHGNDDGEWQRDHGAGIYVRVAQGITVKECRARRTQNGLILDRVDDSRVFDNDFSFLSGWGLAMWRASRNTITRNSFDFCVRGYSHGVYNRGQDSAGILMFEQCSNNTIAQNSATHGGDGFFGFAGREALGENPPPTEDFDYKRRGNCDNLLVYNDFSHCAAHGIEMTFSFGNQFLENRLWGNAICGIWAGYSKGSRIGRNQIGRNGDAGYGLERGGINIEHGRFNYIGQNVFVENAVGVHLWWDSDPGLLDLPWTKVNGAESRENQILGNQFRRDDIAIELRNCLKTMVTGNEFEDVRQLIEADNRMEVITEGIITPITVPQFKAYGKLNPMLAYERLGGREAIVMTEWGPYDYEAPLLHRLADVGDAHAYRLLGPAPLVSATATGPVTVTVEAPSRGKLGHILVAPAEGATHGTYDLEVKMEAGALHAKGAFVVTKWNVRAFAYETDPREDVDQWRAEAATAAAGELPELALVFGGGGPSDLPVLGEAVTAAGIAGNRFGILADTKVTLPAGKWRLETRSDDGIHVWVDGALVVDDWTHHGPTAHDADLSFAEEKEHEVRVEYFELDGHAELTVRLVPAD